MFTVKSSFGIKHLIFIELVLVRWQSGGTIFGLSRVLEITITPQLHSMTKSSIYTSIHLYIYTSEHQYIYTYIHVLHQCIHVCIAQYLFHKEAEECQYLTWCYVLMLWHLYTFYSAEVRSPWIIKTELDDDLSYLFLPFRLHSVIDHT